MEKVVRFYKAGNKWFADISDHTEEENEMVFGSDTLLDLLSPQGKNIFVRVSDIEPESYLSKFEMFDHDPENGGIYWNSDDHREQIYLCNVAHDIFCDHPAELYIINYQYEENI